MMRAERRRLIGWPLAIVVFFAALVAFHAVVIYLSVSNPDPVVESYDTPNR